MTFPLFRFAANAKLIDSHFLCCHHTDIAPTVFVGLPLASAALGPFAARQMFKIGPQLKGLTLSVCGITLGTIFAVMGLLLIAGLKA
ncbi:MAG: hypothetical protein NTU53_08810 [Planctomycetota bacterium]|nr:hypothetical protein [Planctomycetota bacterium]